MTIGELLAGHSPVVRDLALRACQLVRSVLPDAVVKVHRGWKDIFFGTGTRMGDIVVAVIPHRSRINLQLAGADLPGPAGLLEGTGKMGRHVKVTSPALLEDPAVRDLLLAAVAHQSHPAAERIAKAGPPPHGYRAYASKTVDVPLDTLFAAWTDDDARRRWLGDHPVAMVFCDWLVVERDDRVKGRVDGVRTGWLPPNLGVPRMGVHL